MRMRGKLPIFSVKDTWNLDTTLSVIIYHGLLKFKECYNPDYDGYPYCEEIESADQWIEIIDKMIFAFDMDNEPDIMNYKFDINPVRNGQGYTTLSITDEPNYLLYKIDMDTYEEKCKEGLELFAKYFYSLWT